MSEDRISRVSVRLLDRQYEVACPAEERSDLLDSAEYLDSKMREVRDSGKVVGLDRIAASLPPRHLLPNDPTLVTLAPRLREFATGLRQLTTAVSIDYSDQILMRDLLYLSDSPFLR